MCYILDLNLKLKIKMLNANANAKCKMEMGIKIRVARYTGFAVVEHRKAGSQMHVHVGRMGWNRRLTNNSMMMAHGAWLMAHAGASAICDMLMLILKIDFADYKLSIRIRHRTFTFKKNK
jgi:hypothetical protein